MAPIHFCLSLRLAHQPCPMKTLFLQTKVVLKAIYNRSDVNSSSILHTPPPHTSNRKALYPWCAKCSVSESSCGDPPAVLNTGQVWNGSSTPGSTVVYFCKTGFYHHEGINESMCTKNGYWTKPGILCKGNIVPKIKWFLLPYSPQTNMFSSHSAERCHLRVCRSWLWRACSPPSCRHAVG